MVKIFDSENKYKTILVILLILFVSIIAMSITISNVEFEEKPEGTIATVVNEGDLVINYNDGEMISFNDSLEHSYKISITNNSSTKIYYSIYFTCLFLPFKKVASGNFKLFVYLPLYFY